jgi:hypothetical protein
VLGGGGEEDAGVASTLGSVSFKQGNWVCVGHRRRKQWLNDKLLRDLAGPMSTQDMGRQRAAQGGVLVPIHSVAACSGQCRQVEAES